jgi:hypothetical protein
MHLAACPKRNASARFSAVKVKVYSSFVVLVDALKLQAKRKFADKTTS